MSGPSDRWPIDARDPKGRRVRCSKFWWEKHITVPKPEFAAYEMDVEVNRAIADPDEITLDKSDPARRCYYRKAPMQHPNELIKAVARFGRFGGSGRLVTCYLVRGVPPGETSEWKRP